MLQCLVNFKQTAGCYIISHGIWYPQKTRPGFHFPKAARTFKARLKQGKCWSPLNGMLNDEGKDGTACISCRAIDSLQIILWHLWHHWWCRISITAFHIQRFPPSCHPQNPWPEQQEMPIDQCSIRPENQMPRSKETFQPQNARHNTWHQQEHWWHQFFRTSLNLPKSVISLAKTLPKLETPHPLLKCPSNLRLIRSFFTNLSKLWMPRYPFGSVVGNGLPDPDDVGIHVAHLGRPACATVGWLVGWLIGWLSM